MAGDEPNRAKDELLATLSHELRTHLNAVIGWTRMLRRGEVPPDRTRSILETIERNATAQMQIVEKLVDLSSMSFGAEASEPPHLHLPAESPNTTEVTLRG